MRGTIAAELRKNRVPYHEVHLDKVDGETLAKYKRVIVSARDPVDRVVSAFNWRSPHACRQRKGECTPAARSSTASGGSTTVFRTCSILLMR